MTFRHPPLRLLVLAVVGATVALAAPARAATIRPNTTFDETAAGGTCSLREAVESANANADFGGCTHTGTYGTDTILLGGGDYDLSLSGTPEDANASGDLDVTQSLTIRGLGAGDTGIDGNGGITNDRVLDNTSTTATLSVVGVVVHDGRTTGFGGGMYSAGPVNVTASAVSANLAASGGGGIAGGVVNVTASVVDGNASAAASASGGGISATTLQLTNSAVTDNTVASFGGGVSVQSGGTISSSNVSHNRNTGGPGGGVKASNSITVTGSTIADNTAATYGGGISGNANLFNSTVSGNTANGSPGGGGIAGTVNVTDSRVTGNATSAAGGGIYGIGTITRSVVRRNRSGGHGGGVNSGPGLGTLGITRSTIADNDAAGSNTQGGGVYFGAETLSVVNSTITGNEASGFGGGISSGAGTTTLQNATITRNTADSEADNFGGGGGIDQAPGATLNLRNTIVAGNQDRTGQEPDCHANSGIASQGYNLFGTNTSCVTLVTGDQDLAGASPLVGQIKDNGGPTPTAALLKGSPARNAGNPAAPGSGGNACAAVDQRGVRRPQEQRCDIGAYELALPKIVIARPAAGAHYKLGARILASYSCKEAGLSSLIASCVGTVPNGKRINTATLGQKSFTVTAVDKGGNKTVKTVHYTVVA